MKIAVFHELNSGGARRAVNEFSKALKKRKHVVDLFYVDEKAHDEEKANFSNSFFSRFIPVEWNGHNWKARLYRDTIELLKLFRLHKKIAHNIDSGNYDVVFVHPSKYTQAPFLLKLLKTPTLYYCQEPLRMVYEDIFAVPQNLPLAKKLYEKVIRSIRKRIDAENIHAASFVLANSNFTRENVHECYGIHAETCHMGVDTKVFYPDGKKDIDLLFIGTRDETEGYGLFQNALANIKTKAKIEYMIRGENWTSNDEELRKKYSRSKIVICFGYNEPFGLIPIEAMASGACIVALDEGGYKDSVLHRSTGLLVEKNAKLIAKNVDFLLQHPNELEKMFHASVEKVQTYWTWERGAQEIERLATLLKHSSKREI